MAHIGASHKIIGGVVLGSHHIKSLTAVCKTSLVLYIQVLIFYFPTALKPPPIKTKYWKKPLSVAMGARGSWARILEDENSWCLGKCQTQALQQDHCNLKKIPASKKICRYWKWCGVGPGDCSWIDTAANPSNVSSGQPLPQPELLWGYPSSQVSCHRANCLDT